MMAGAGICAKFLILHSFSHSSHCLSSKIYGECVLGLTPGLSVNKNWGLGNTQISFGRSEDEVLEWGVVHFLGERE